MQFASPLPWWALALVAAAIGAFAFLSYRRPLVPLTRAQRGILIGLRVLSLAAVVFFLCRPVVLMPPSADREAVVPVLVDVSRSMRVADADGQPRLTRAAALVRDRLLPALSSHFVPEVYAIGEGLEASSVDALTADRRHSDLQGALAAVRERYRGRAVPGIVVISDGGDTGARADADLSSGPPVFTIGVGSPEGIPDREVLGIAAGDPRLDEASVDLRVEVVSHGFGRSPFQLRILANGQLIDTRRVTPIADGSPADEVFTVAPDPVTATVYTAEIATDDSERIPENNARSVLVSPAGRKRRILAIEGAPGFEHSFLMRALARDRGLELDAIVRKGKNAEGDDTFFVQAGANRAAALTGGFPARREALYAYDAVIVANVEGDFFTRAQLTMAAEFVAERGGGLLVFGGRSLAQRGYIGTPLEEALPVELNDRRGGLARASLGVSASGSHNTVLVTPEGENHPVMRIAATPEESRKVWAALPALAGSAPLGGPRPGATVLAVTSAPGGAMYPVVAVQRYGRGRSMVFAGEASWRWRMMTKSTDRSFEYFWRQAARWLSAPASDPVSIAVPDAAEPGDSVAIVVDARDGSFAPVPDARIDATLTAAAGDEQPLTLRREAGGSGRFTTTLRPERPGLYRVRAEARSGTTSLGAAERWFHVGGGDREFADPRLNEPLLRRISRTSGGRYARAGEVSDLASWLRAAAPPPAAPERRDLWHQPWAFALVIALMSAEWVLRRRWGLR
jgi:uncharacterized membrane protein